MMSHRSKRMINLLIRLMKENEVLRRAVSPRLGRMLSKNVTMLRKPGTRWRHPAVLVC